MRRVKYFMPLLGLVIVLVLAGCGVDRSRYTAFKDGAAALSVETKTAYAGVVKTRDRLVSLCAASNDNKEELYRKPKAEVEAGCSSQVGIPWPQTTEDAKQTADMEDLLAYRSAAVDALADYAKTLHTLATTDYVAGAEAGATKISASFASFAEVTVPTLEPELRKSISAGLGTIVRELAALYVERRRVEGLKRVMNQAQPHVETLATLLQRDNRRVVVYAKSGHLLYVKLARELRPGAKSDRITYDEQVYNSQREFEAGLGVLEGTSKAIAMLPALHKELLTSLDDEAAPFAQLQMFVEEIQKAHEFYKKLNK